MASPGRESGACTSGGSRGSCKYKWRHAKASGLLVPEALSRDMERQWVQFHHTKEEHPNVIYSGLGKRLVANIETSRQARANGRGYATSMRRVAKRAPTEGVRNEHEKRRQVRANGRAGATSGKSFMSTVVRTSRSRTVCTHRIWR